MTTPTEGRALLAIARAALEEALEERPPRPNSETPSSETPSPAPPIPKASSAEERSRPGACFVTLSRAGKLRGCIGTIEAHRALADDARENAVAAALRDPRFPPLTASELPEVSLELSVLSVPEPLAFRDEADLLRRLRPGRDGLILACGVRRGVFLPAVWRSLPEPAAFLRQLKVKAGLAEDFWSSDLEIRRFETASFREEGAGRAGPSIPP